MDKFEKLIESAKTNRKSFNTLKHAVVACQQYELAAQLREIELATWPETPEIKEIKRNAENLKKVFTNLNLKAKTSDVWLIAEAIDLYKKKGDFSIQDSVDLQLEKERIFQDEQ